MATEKKIVALHRTARSQPLCEAAVGKHHGLFTPSNQAIWILSDCKVQVGRLRRSLTPEFHVNSPIAAIDTTSAGVARSRGLASEPMRFRAGANNAKQRPRCSQDKCSQRALSAARCMARSLLARARHQHCALRTRRRTPTRPAAVRTGTVCTTRAHPRLRSDLARHRQRRAAVPATVAHRGLAPLGVRAAASTLR